MECDDICGDPTAATEEKTKQKCKKKERKTDLN